VRQNLDNLYFPIYCASARDCCWRLRKPDASNKQLYFQMTAMLKPSAEYNQRAVIIEGLRAGRSTNNLVLWIFEINRL